MLQSAGNLGPPTASGAESRQRDWRLENWKLEPSVTSTEHQEPSAVVDRPFISGEAHPSVPMPMQMPIRTGWANQLTWSLAQLSRSTRGCSSHKGQRPKVGQRRNGNTGRTVEGRTRARTCGRRQCGRRGFRHLMPDLLTPPSLHLGKGACIESAEHWTGRAEVGHGAIVEEGRGRSGWSG